MARTALNQVELSLRDKALTYPESTEDFPWGHRALKVKGKAFCFMSSEGGELSLSVKLPETGQAALTLPFTQPTGYGLGKSGWVSATFKPGDVPPADLLMAWLAESYRAVAPKKLGALLAGGGASVTPAAAKVQPKRKARPAAARATSKTTRKKGGAAKSRLKSAKR
jgi:predicted DNA-binding protein (MmcQ/YjbR family)